MFKKIASLLTAVLTVFSLSVTAFATYTPEDGYYLVEPSNAILNSYFNGGGSAVGTNSVYVTKAEIVVDGDGKMADFPVVVFTLANSTNDFTMQKCTMNDSEVTMEKDGNQIIVRSHTASLDLKRISTNITIWDATSSKNIGITLGCEQTGHKAMNPTPTPDPKPDPKPDPTLTKPVVLPDAPKPSDEAVKVNPTGNSTLDTILSSIMKVFSNAKIFGVWIVTGAVMIGAIFIVALWLWRMLRTWLQRAKG